MSFDQAEEMAGVAIDGLQGVEVALRQVATDLFQQAVGETEDRIHRGAQFVRHAGEERALGFAGLLGRALGGDEILFRPPPIADVVDEALE